MRALLLFAFAVGEHAAAISEKERAEADAMAVLSSLLKTLESASSTAQLLDSRFSAWCENALLSQRSFAEEVQREMAEAETSEEQVTADEARLQSETRLSSASITAADQDQVAASATREQFVQAGKDETSLLERASELTTHALRLVANRGALQTADEAGAAEGAGTALQALLEDLQQEVEQQRVAVQQEQEAAATLYANSSAQASLAGSALLAEKNAVGIEGRERVRAKARFASVSSDLRRLLLAIEKAVNVTQKVCDAEEVSVRGEDGVADAEMDAVHAVLDQVSPDLEAPTFTQLFLERRAAAKQIGIGSQFRDFALRMSRQSKFSSPAFLDAVQSLSASKPALVTESAKSGTTATTSALAEIADFAKPENDDVEASAAKTAYRQLTAKLKREISDTAALGLECSQAASNASADMQLRQHEASLADAQLSALNMTTEEMKKTASYFSSQLKSLHSDAAQFADLVKLEVGDHDKLGADLKSFTQQMVSVATEITGVGEKKVGRELEQLVERLQAHSNAVDERHATYLKWQESIKKGAAALERVLAVDFGHAKHKLQSYATDAVFLAAMERAKKRDQVTANQQLANVLARCPEDQEAVRRTKQAALEEQLREVTSYWASLRV